jgi:hypothetical protein
MFHGYIFHGYMFHAFVKSWFADFLVSLFCCRLRVAARGEYRHGISSLGLRIY